MAQRGNCSIDVIVLWCKGEISGKEAESSNGTVISWGERG